MTKTPSTSRNLKNSHTRTRQAVLPLQTKNSASRTWVKSARRSRQSCLRRRKNCELKMSSKKAFPKRTRHYPLSKKNCVECESCSPTKKRNMNREWRRKRNRYRSQHQCSSLSTVVHQKVRSTRSIQRGYKTQFYQATLTCDNGDRTRSQHHDCHQDYWV